MNKIRDKLLTVGTKIKQFSAKYGIGKSGVQLLAVSKRHPADLIREAYQAGQIAFGENYAQEMTEKAGLLEDLEIEWHFIGPLQSNKTKGIAETAHWVHTIERLKIAKRLNSQRPDTLPPLNICIQINIDEEQTKSGIHLKDLNTVAAEISQLKNLRLRGLMAIPAPEADFLKQRHAFANVKQAYEDLIKQGFKLDTLSMGMSNDMEAAIAEGATIVRIGTAIFGKRD